MATTINLIANDVPGSFPIDPTSIALSNIDPSLSVVDNNDGTVDVSGVLIGQFTFDYTVSDTMANVSNVATVTVQIQPTPVAPNAVAGLVEWLDASTLTAVDGQSINSWTAVVGNDGVAGSATPVYRVAGINGLPAIEFAGNTNSRYDIADPFGALTPEYTIFLVVESRTLNQQGMMLSNRLGTGGGGVTLFADTGGPEEINFLSYPSGDSLLTSGIPANTPVVLAFRRNATGKQIFTDLVQVAINSVPDVLTNNDWKLAGEPLIGGNWNYPGNVAELVMYAAALTDVDTFNVIAGLKQKYGI